LRQILELGADPVRGFHHPLLKPNRFHSEPRYPVDRYMCLGLYWDPRDYRYHEVIPTSGQVPHGLPGEWSELYARLLEELFPSERGVVPETALVNYYRDGRRMGQHVDKEEEDHVAPVLGVSFGAATRFYFLGPRGEKQSLLLPGNSVYVFGHRARLMPHSVGQPLLKNFSSEAHGLLLPGERLSVTLRRVRGERKLRAP